MKVYIVWPVSFCSIAASWFRCDTVSSPRTVSAQHVSNRLMWALSTWKQSFTQVGILVHFCYITLVKVGYWRLST